MLLLLIFLPLIGILIISSVLDNINAAKITALFISALTFIISLIIFLLFNQFINISLCIFVMLISIIINWNWNENIISLFLWLQTLIFSVFLVLDILLFYITFESTLPPLFLLLGLLIEIFTIYSIIIIITTLIYLEEEEFNKKSSIQSFCCRPLPPYLPSPSEEGWFEDPPLRSQVKFEDSPLRVEKKFKDSPLRLEEKFRHSMYKKSHLKFKGNYKSQLKFKGNYKSYKRKF